MNVGSMWGKPRHILYTCTSMHIDKWDRTTSCAIGNANINTWYQKHILKVIIQCLYLCTWVIIVLIKW